MFWSKAQEQQQEENTGGLYKWTMDALFGVKVSPSKKYCEFAQDDTNYRRRDKQKTKKSSWEGGLYYAGRDRSNSCGNNQEFMQRYELLPDEEEEGLLRPVKSPASFHPTGVYSRRYMDDFTDTFAGRKTGNFLRDPSLKFKSPPKDDPLISKLFGKDTPNAEIGNDDGMSGYTTKRTLPKEYPGKFPSPEKAPNKGRLGQDSRDYTNDYIQLLDRLELNNRQLDEIQNDILETQQQQQFKESTYREKYLAMRNELINELKQSKKIYDNYYKLYSKYKGLRGNVGSTSELTSRITQLEAQVVDITIEKETEVKKLNNEIFKLELRQQEMENKHRLETLQNETRIAELEKLLQGQHSQRQEASPARKLAASSDSSFKEYNTTIDTQFLSNLVR